MNIGVIAEDDSDVRVVSEFTLALLRPRTAGFKKFVGNGCGKLRRKCAAWAVNLVERDCQWIIVVHDLDLNDEKVLRRQLNNSVQGCGARAALVLIPRHEIEAWLLYDAKAIASAFKENARPRLPGDPESLADPKAHLRQLVRKKYDKTYLSTVHNALIAKHIDIPLLRRSGSFSPHFNFVESVKRAIQ